MGKSRSITPLKLHRIQSGYLQTEVARMLGLSQPSYCLREQGEYRCTVDEGIRLSRILKIPVEELFKKDGRR